jgi:signal transduction histidine kinase
VGVSVPTEDDHVLVRIADNGSGIPTTKKNGSSARASAVARAGTGMGLSLVETLVK